MLLPVIPSAKWEGQLVNLHPSWTLADDRHEVALFGQNVTNIHYALLPTDLSVFVQTGPEFFAGGNYLFNMRLGPWQSIGITFREKF